MTHIQTFQVYPKVPESTRFVETLVRNMWWCWNLDAIELFRRIDPKLWNRAGRNPIQFFSQIPQRQLESTARDKSFLSHLERVKAAYEKQVEPPVENSEDIGPIAYFSMEYGIHESLPLYAGGLGMLAGDHLKAASDRGEPMVGVGLLYRMGYFHQYLDQSGWQQEEYPETDLYQLPIERARDENGNEVKIAVPGPDGDIHAQVLRIMVGRVPLFLLDTNLQANTPENRNITAKLYTADSKNRLAQEVLLGIGGMKALEALGIQPTTCHLNEGHCSFVILERISQLMRQNHIDLGTAREIVPRSTVFTTHTPVAAGHDEFPLDMVKPFLKPYENDFGVSMDEIISWGQIKQTDNHPPFSMFGLGLRNAEYCNGVSELHGHTARKMWNKIWPGLPENEVPIDHVTNGVHIPSWISIENAMLFERYLGPEWYLHTWHQPEIIDRIDDIYDEELWRAHEMSRARLIRTCRQLMTLQYGRRNAPKSIMEDAAAVLDHDALSIGFARRFATYKRAYMLLQDPERLEAMLTNRQQPIQIIIAGKAHPKDNEGKGVIQQLIEFGRRAKIRHRFIFLEDYDPYIARHLIQGCDIWLNTPRRPYEACGTSGIKAAVNGVLNASILDGWWCEGYGPDRGWKIGSGEEFEDWDFQDSVESQALYNLLENEIIPKFYDRKDGDIPNTWIQMMKGSMKMAMKQFCAHGMLGRYLETGYRPASRRFHELTANQASAAKELMRLEDRLKKHWNQVYVERPTRNLDGPFRVGDNFEVTVKVYLGELLPEEVDVELCYGKIRSVEALENIQAEKMTVKEDLGEGTYIYESDLTCEISGRYGLTARVTPKGDRLLKYSPGMIVWASE
ncbi:MAG: alpha-glucan family phosphorylase [Desulfobacterales bacterium]|nr:alpha-glucan family phosphorylase [Desulfobacterales bacterium]